MNAEVEKFIDKYVNFFEKEFGRTRESYYRFFDNNDFPNDCQALGFEMDCGHSFIEAYGEAAWNTVQGLKDSIDKIDDIKTIGNALFSQWRFFNHWSSPSYANEDTKEWFLLLSQRLRMLSKNKGCNNPV